MRRYETIIIIDPDLSTAERSPVLERVKEVIEQQGGFLALLDDWGAKKLAYEIKKKERGYYLRCDYCGTGALVDEMERFFRIDDRVLKYMTVMTDRIVDIEKIKEEIAKAESKADLTGESVEPPESDIPESEESEEDVVEPTPIESEEETK